MGNEELIQCEVGLNDFRIWPVSRMRTESVSSVKLPCRPLRITTYGPLQDRHAGQLRAVVETRAFGWPRRAISASSSRACSTVARMRKHRPSVKQSDTKSSVQRSLGPLDSAIGSARPMPACGHHVCVHTASLPGRAGGSAFHTLDSPRGSATDAVDGSGSDAAGRRAPECAAVSHARRLR